MANRNHDHPTFLFQSNSQPSALPVGCLLRFPILVYDREHELLVRERAHAVIGMVRRLYLCTVASSTVLRVHQRDTVNPYIVFTCNVLNNMVKSTE